MQVKIGLEIHIQLNTYSKLFSKSFNQFLCDINRNVSFLDLGIPGSLPLLNKEVIFNSIFIGLSLHGNINNFLFFDRKNYFYSDLPHGYQITQAFRPVIYSGFLLLNNRKVFINQIHLEQDAAKSFYFDSYNYIDYNRFGIPLVEIVTNPNFYNFFEIENFISKIQTLFRYINLSLVQFENGSIRCDINISIFNNQKIEIKNLNSLQSIKFSLYYEIKRQFLLFKNDCFIYQETRFYNEDSFTTNAARMKENFFEYKYLHDPDLLTLRIPYKITNHIMLILSESLDNKKKKFLSLFFLTSKQIYILLNNKILYCLFIRLINTINPFLVASIICSYIYIFLKLKKIYIYNIIYIFFNLIKLLKIFLLNQKTAFFFKRILYILLQTNYNPFFIIEYYNISLYDKYFNLIHLCIDKIFLIFTKDLEKYKRGTSKIINFFLGKIIIMTYNKIDPVYIKRIILSRMIC